MKKIIWIVGAAVCSVVGAVFYMTMGGTIALVVMATMWFTIGFMAVVMALYLDVAVANSKGMSFWEYQTSIGYTGIHTHILGSWTSNIV